MRRYQRMIIAPLILTLIFILGLTALVTYRAAQAIDIQAGTVTPMPTLVAPVPGQLGDDLATQVFSNAASAASAAEDAQRYAQEASDAVSKQLDIANDLLGLFQNVTAIVGVLIPVLALAGAVLGFNQINEAQRKSEEQLKEAQDKLNEARARFEIEMKEKQAELQNVREAMERSTTQQREIAFNANLALSLLTLGERQYRSADLSGALNTYRRALELDPESLITHYRLGYVYTQSGELENAQHHLTRALEIEKDFSPAVATLGYVYRRIGEKMAQGIDRDTMLNYAETYLLKALSASPKLMDEDNESWWGSLGGLYRRRNQVDEAIRAYEQAAEVSPTSSYAFSNLALLYMQRRDRDRMIKTYHKVDKLAWGEVQSDVNNYWAYADLLTARLALGKVKDAEETLLSVLEIAPVDSPYALESLIDTLSRLQQALTPDESKHIPDFIERIRQQQEINKTASANKT